MLWITVACVVTFLMVFPLQIACAKLADIYWNSSNPIFRIDNTDHIIDVNKGNIPFEYDQVNIICPAYTQGTKEEDVERYIIYNVSKEEYDSCRITNPESRIIAICDRPHQLMYFTITFRSFTPVPGGLEFRPGQDYYFISTSGGVGDSDSMYQRVGGKCATHNMKVIFKVCCSPATSTTIIPSSTSTAVSTTSTLSPVPSTTTFFRYFRPLTTPRYRFPPFITSKYPPPVKSFDYPIREEERSKISSKKTEDRDKLPNQTRAKNEELVNNFNRAAAASPHISLIIALLLFCYQLFSKR